MMCGRRRRALHTLSRLEHRAHYHNPEERFLRTRDAGRVLVAGACEASSVALMRGPCGRSARSSVALVRPRFRRLIGLRRDTCLPLRITSATSYCCFPHAGSGERASQEQGAALVSTLALQRIHPPDAATSQANIVRPSSQRGLRPQ